MKRYWPQQVSKCALFMAVAQAIACSMQRAQAARYLAICASIGPGSIDTALDGAEEIALAIANFVDRGGIKPQILVSAALNVDGRDLYAPEFREA